MNVTAVILAAGEGTRLLPFTLNKPKCLVEVNGVPIIYRALSAIKSAGIEKAIIVDGYRGEVLRAECGTDYEGVHLSYIRNDIYKTTNSMYSLKMGLELVDGDALVIEGDVFFENSIIDFSSRSALTWLVDSSFSYSGGSYLRHNPDEVLTGVEIVRSPETVVLGMSKSVGIVHVDSGSVGLVIEWLQEAINQGDSNLYYDLVFAKHVSDALIKVKDVSGKRWVEIDTPEELQFAETLFK